MNPTLAELMKAADDLQDVGRKIFDTVGALWDEEERMFERAMAVLHAHIKELNQA